MEQATGERTAVIDLILQETRWRILDHLMREGRATLSDLSRKIGCTRQNVHHHLQRLEASGLAYVVDEEETNGLPRYYWGTDLDEHAPDDGRMTPMELTRVLMESREDGPPAEPF